MEHAIGGRGQGRHQRQRIFDATGHQLHAARLQIRCRLRVAHQRRDLDGFRKQAFEHMPAEKSAGSGQHDPHALYSFASIRMWVWMSLSISRCHGAQTV